MDKGLNVVYHDKKQFDDGIRHHLIIKQEDGNVFDVIYFDGENRELFNLSRIHNNSPIEKVRYFRDDYDFHHFEYVLTFIRKYLGEI
tara:strand:- start:169 stop:429 length:261 start_codon:yes stop_codon:yes gene_type:complete